MRYARKIRSILTPLMLGLLLCLFAVLPASAAAEIVISTADELIALSKRDFAEISTQTIKLANDIDMAGRGALAPIGGSEAFNGTFDGQGYYIKNLSITGTGNCTGLFGHVGTQGVIKNLGLYDVTVSGQYNTGSIAGVMTGSVTQCYATGSVSGKYYTGGLVGLLHAGTLENCMADIAVTVSSGYGGGLFGGTDYEADEKGSPLTAAITSKPMVIRNNLVLSTVKCGSAGGMLGDMGNSKTSPLASFDGNVMWNKSVTATGKTSSYGPVFAWWTNGTRKYDTLPMSYDNLYWNEMPLTGSGSTYAADDTRYTTYRMVAASAGELESQSTYEALNWDFNSVWTWDDLLGHPILKNVSLYREPAVLIYTVEDFLEFADPANFADVNGQKAYLMNDLNLSGVVIEPIGGAAAYTGVFDGRDHTLHNLTVTGTGSCTGLFGHVGIEGSIKNLGLDRVSVTGGNNTGALAGVMTGEISECFVTGVISGTKYVGGIAGMLHTGLIENCWADVIVTASGNYAGGIFGGSDYNTRKSDSPLTARITTQNLRLRNTLSLGTVSASSYPGGILGDVGNSGAGKVKTFEANVAWTEQITGKKYGPIYGWFSDGQTTVVPNYNNVYFDGMLLPGTTPSSNMDTALKITSKTAAELGKQETYETGLGWDFDDTWVWSTKLGHPVLQGFAVPDNYIPGEQKTPASLVTTYAGSPKTTRAFTWYTDTDITGSVVQIVKAADYSSTSSFTGGVTGTSYKLQTAEDGTSRTIHKVNVTGLEPGTAYRYRAGDGTYWSGVYTFTTEPETADSFTFFSMTDTQAAYTNYANVLKHATAAYPEAAFILHGGDVIQENATPDYDSIFKLTAKYVATLPTMVTPGNHELAKDVTNGNFTPDYVKGLDNYISHYQFPSNGPENGDQIIYSFDYGDAHFIVLNTNTSGYPSLTKQIEWMKQDLAKTDKTWRIVSLHHGPYDAYGPRKSNMINAMAELDIDLVMFGHNHVLLRSNPIADGVQADSIQLADGSYLGYASAPSYYSSGCAGGNTGSLTVDKNAEALPFFTVNAMPFKGSSYGAITVTKNEITIRSHALATNGNTQLVDTYIIRKPQATGTAPTAKALTYTASAQTLVDAGSANEGAKLVYSTDGITFSDALPTGLNAGSYTLYYKFAAVDDQHSDSDVMTLTATIAPVDITDAAISLGDSLTYNGYEQTQAIASATVNSFTLADGTDYTVSGNTATDAGSYTLTLTGMGNFTGTATAAWTIAEGAASYTAPTALNPIYNGQPQALISAGTASGGRMLYSLDGVNFSENIPTAMGAGNYTVWYTVAGDENHGDSPAQSITASILPKNIANAVITLDDALTYNGSQQMQAISSVSVDGLMLTAGTDYTVSGNTATDAGSYMLTLTGMGNFTGTATASWTISIQGNVTFVPPTAKDGLVYNGQPQALVIPGSTDDGIMLYSLDGVNFSENIPTAMDAGNYTVWYKVAGDENHGDIDAQNLTVTIAKLDIASADLVVTLGETPIYDGEEKTQTLSSVTANGIPVTYTVSGNTGVGAGDYTLTITATGNFTGAAIVRWRIAQNPLYLPKTGDNTHPALWVAAMLIACTALAILGRKRSKA